MTEIEGVMTVLLVYDGGLLRTGSDSLLLRVWRSARDVFTSKGDPDVLVVRTGT